MRLNLIVPKLSCYSLSRPRALKQLLSIASIASLLVSCANNSGSPAAFVEMLDCTLNQLGSLHIHKNRDDRNVTVITNYDPRDPDHKAAIARGTKNYGVSRQLVTGRGATANDTTHEVELFLLKESLGEAKNESVILRLNPQGGRLVMLARSNPGITGGQGLERILDQGACRKR
jgi:hypothetical protein